VESVKFQILVPHYKETEDIIKPLLDSIEIQQNVDLTNDVGVIIVNDGAEVILSDEFLGKYTFPIEYFTKENGGVSSARNAALDRSTADYVMFCDADDMFYNACGLYIIFQEINNGGFDSLISMFVEETRHPITKEPIYINREMDTTFVHGKVHRRQFLLDNNIRWNNALTIHEDSYFNCLCQKLATNLKYCQAPFYLWKWRDQSVCRHDPKYILKTYNNMLDSNTALVTELLNRGRQQDAQSFATTMIYDAYFTMNKDEWINQENREYRQATETRFKKYYLEFENLFKSTPIDIKNQIIIGVKNRFFSEGLMMESVTFDAWIKHILEL
jgi:glycosyltransferase involved in cell wall biosynthesis